MEGKKLFVTDTDKIYMSDDKENVIAEIDFVETAPGILTIEHTFVDSSLRGQGIAAKLVEAAVKEIHSRGKKVQATCSYAAKWLKEHEIDES